MPPKDFWLVAGNSQTDPTHDFLGTSDGQPLVIRTAGTEHLRIDPAGNVGIGTPSPAHPLHLATGKALRIEGGTSQTDDASYFSFGGNGAFSIDAPGIPGGRFLVDNSGNLGLGTTSPQAKLDVSISGGGSPQPFVARLHQESTLGVGQDSNALLRFSHWNGSNSREWTIGTGSASLFGHPDFFGIHDTVSGVGLVIDQFANVTMSHNLTVGGNISVSGDVQLTGADCAEQFDLSGGAELPEPGTVVVLGDGGGLVVSQQPYDRKAVGVISGAGDYRQAILLDKRDDCSERRAAVALAGKVWCRVDARYAPVEVGDLLTTSPTPGYAMKATDPLRAFGSVVGKALRALDGKQGLIPIVVALQ
jgi:hypothetical protein